jgi:hypothetical protein
MVHVSKPKHPLLQLNHNDDTVLAAGPSDSTRVLLVRHDGVRDTGGSNRASGVGALEEHEKKRYSPSLPRHSYEGSWSALFAEGAPRESKPEVAHCTFRRALLTLGLARYQLYLLKKSNNEQETSSYIPLAPT